MTIQQSDSAKVDKKNSFYDLFPDYKKDMQESVVEQNKEPVKEPSKEMSNIEKFSEKYGNNLVGTKLVNAINEFGKDVEGFGKDSFAKEYIKVRQPNLTSEQVKSQFKQDKGKVEGIDYSPFLREGYKLLEGYGIKVGEPKKTTTKEPKKEIEKPKDKTENIVPVIATEVEKIEKDKIENIEEKKDIEKKIEENPSLKKKLLSIGLKALNNPIKLPQNIIGLGIDLSKLFKK